MTGDEVTSRIGEQDARAGRPGRGERQIMPTIPLKLSRGTKKKYQAILAERYNRPKDYDIVQLIHFALQEVVHTKTKGNKTMNETDKHVPVEKRLASDKIILPGGCIVQFAGVSLYLTGDTLFYGDKSKFQVVGCSSRPKEDPVYSIYPRDTVAT